MYAIVVVFSVPPTQLEISGILSGTRLEVKEHEEVELQCIVHEAKPKANIVWFRQNSPFGDDAGEYNSSIMSRLFLIL